MQLTPVEPNVTQLLSPLVGSRCLVTGASGFLGRNMIASLLAVDAEVHIVTHSRPREEIPLGDRTLALDCDLSSSTEVEAVFAEVRPEFVFHFATARGNSMQDRDAVIKGNILAADSLIRAALVWMPKRMVVAHGSLEYGPHSCPLSEQIALAPITLYGATKAAAALLFQQAACEHRLPVVMLRVFSVYGYWEPWKRLIPTTMLALSTGRSLPLTAGDYRRDFVFVADVVEAFIRAALIPGIDGEIINIGSGIQTSNEEIVRRLAAISGRPLTIDKGAYAPHSTDTEFWCADSTKARRLLEWTPQHSLNEGLAKTWDWFREVAPRYVG